MELINAAKKCDFELAFSLIASKYPVNGRDSDNATPLYWSAIRGHARMCDVLVQAGCDVNARVTWGSTALHAAADRGHTECVEVLIRSHVDIDRQNNRGDTALHIASYRGNTDIARMLLQAGATLGLQNNQGKTAKEEAMAGNHADILQLISAARNGTLAQQAMSQAQHHRQALSQLSQNIPDTGQRRNDLSSSRESLTPSVETTELCFTPPNQARRLPTQILKGICERSNSFSSGPTENEEQQQRQSSEQPAHRMDNRFSAYRRSSVGGDGEFSLVTKHHSLLLPETMEESMPMTNDSLSETYMSSSSDTTSDRRPTGDNSESTVFSFPLQNRPLNRLTGRPLRSSTGTLVGDVTLFNAIETYSASLHENMLKTNIKLEKANQTIAALRCQNESLTTQCLSYKAEVDRLLREHRESPLQQNVVLDPLAFPYRIPQEAGIARDQGSSEQQSSSNPSYNLTDSHFRVLLNSLYSESAQESVSFDTLYEKTKKTAKSVILRRCHVTCLDTPGREWVPGVDYVILGPNPIYWMGKVGEETKFSLTFQIKHANTKCKYRLQLKWNQRSSQYKSRGCRPSSGQFMADLSGGHPNVIPVLHSYDAPTEKFQRFFIQMSQDLSVEISPPAFTLFRVTPLYTMTLADVDSGGGFPNIKQRFGDVPSFLLTITYNLMSGLCFLRDRHIVHRNIQHGTIFIDVHHRPVLGGFELARNLLGDKGQPLVYSDRQDILAGEDCTWAPELVDAYTKGPSKSEPMFLNVLYAASDLYMLGKTMLDSLNKSSQTGNQRVHNGVTSTVFPPCSVGLQAVLEMCVIECPTRRMSLNEAMAKLGVLLLNPRLEEMSTPGGALSYCQARLMKLLAVSERQSNPRHQERADEAETGTTCDVRIETEAHILTTMCSSEIWETYRKLQEDLR